MALQALPKWVNRYREFKARYVVVTRRPFEYPINKYYAHLIDPFFTCAVFRLGVSPNQVTLFSALVGLVAVFCILGQAWWQAAILIQLHHFLDGADGNLARLTNRCTPFGAKLDNICDRIYDLSLFGALAWVAPVPLIAALPFALIPLIEWLLVAKFFTPTAKSYPLIRSRWKAYFLSRGILVGFDIFLVYFCMSLFLLFGAIAPLIYFVLAGKAADLGYRIYECFITLRRNRLSVSPESKYAG